MFLELFATSEPLVLVSIFDHAANMRCARRLYSIVARNAYDAPATACVADAHLFSHLSGLAGTVVAREGRALAFAGGVRLECADVSLADSSLASLRWGAERCRRALQSYRRSISSMDSCPSALARWAADRRIPAELRREDDEVVRRCARLVHAAGCVQMMREGGLTRSVEDVIGAGAGLTPAGDDFLCGMVCLLLSIDDRTSRLKAAALAACLDEELLLHRTTEVSASMLWHAVRGRVASPHRRLLCALVEEPDRVPGCVGEMGRIGGSSGLDFSAGAVCALRHVYQMQEHMACSHMVGQEDL